MLVITLVVGADHTILLFLLKMLPQTCSLILSLAGLFGHQHLWLPGEGLGSPLV